MSQMVELLVTMQVHFLLNIVFSVAAGEIFGGFGRCIQGESHWSCPPQARFFDLGTLYKAECSDFCTFYMYEVFYIFLVENHPPKFLLGGILRQVFSLKRFPKSDNHNFKCAYLACGVPHATCWYAASCIPIKTFVTHPRTARCVYSQATRTQKRRYSHIMTQFDRRRYTNS